LRDCWQSSKDELADFSMKHENLATEVTKTAELIQAYLNEKKKYRKTLVANGDKLTKELRAAEAKELKAKQNYESLKKKQEESEDEANKVSGTAKEAKAKKASEAAAKKAEIADQEYRDAVKQLQASQQKFYHDEMPKILEELQKLEENRMDSMKEWFLAVVSVQETIPPALASASQNMRKVTEAIDRQADIASFISSTTTHSVKPTEAKYEPFSSIDNPALTRQGSRVSMSPVTIRKTDPTSSPTANGAGITQISAATTAAPAASTTAAASTAAPSQTRQLVRALYNYDATEESELSFKANERLMVLQKDDSGWWQGELNGRVGMFPSNFVEVVDPNAPVKEAAAEQKELGGQCKVLYDYNADSDSELTIKEGEVLTVESEDEGWFFGFNSKGESGRFPSNYVQQL